jgi:zinc transporter 2
MTVSYQFLYAVLVAVIVSAETAARLGYNGRAESLESKAGSGSAIEFVWEAPPAGTPIKAALFLAHGCGHSALDFWPKTEACPKCVGLPEERRIVKLALEAGYLVFAVSSHPANRGKCWDIDRDARRIAKAWKYLQQTLAGVDRSLPLLALGASSGGALVARLPFKMPDIAAVCVQIAAVDLSFELIGHPYPASEWVYMSRDQAMLPQIQATVDALRRDGLAVRPIEMKPLRITKTFFSDRIPEVSKSLSSKIFDAFKKNKVIDNGGYIIMDPRLSNWRDALLPLSFDLLPDVLTPDASPISEEMNVAYAQHEIVSDSMKNTIEFFNKAIKDAGVNPRIK